MNHVKIILETISIWIILFPLLTGSWLIKKLSRDSVIIFVLVIAATPPQLVTAFFALHSGTLNILYNIYTPVEFLVLFILFWPKFLSSRNNLIFKLTGIVYLVISTIIAFSFNLKNIFVSEWACTNNIIYIIWTLMYVSEIFFFKEIKITKSKAFTFYLLGIFFYAQCSVLLFAMYYYISQNPTLGNTWIIQSVGNITMYIFFAIGFIVDLKNKPLPATKNYY